MANEVDKNNGEIIIYQSEDGKIRLDVRLEDKTVWLTIDQMAELYGKARSTINGHILNPYKENEIEEAMDKALSEYRKFQVKTLSPVEQAYLESIKMIGKKAKKKD